MSCLLLADTPHTDPTRLSTSPTINGHRLSTPPSTFHLSLHAVMRLLPSIVLLSALSPPTLAVPAGSSIAPDPATPLLRPATFLDQPSQPRRPWNRLRDWAIESLWGRSRSTSRKQSSLPKNVRDRYGSDVVLRFHLRHPHDAEALAAASKVLVLDVWATTTTYVDIRLAEEMVRESTPLPQKTVGRQVAQEIFNCLSLDTLPPRSTSSVFAVQPHSAHGEPRRHDLQYIPSTPLHLVRNRVRLSIGE